MGGHLKEYVLFADRIIDLLKIEWGFTDDDRAVIEVEREKKLAQMIK